MRKTIIGFLIVIAVIIFIIIRLLSGGGGNAPKKSELEDYANSGTTMRFVIDNPTQASTTHREVEIIVGKDQAQLTVYKGYQGDVVRSKSYGMNTDSYADFLRGLRVIGHYTNGNSDPDQKDERGYCPLGDTYVYEIVSDSGDVIQHYWSTSCGPKTFGGNIPVVQQMFENQIPDFDNLTGDINF